VTIAGGVVIDALPPRHRASDRRTAGFLEALESAPAIERVRLFIGHAGPRGSSLAEIAARSGLTDAEINEHAAAHVRAGELVQVAEQPPRWLARAAVDDLQRATVAFLEAFHQRDPLAPGLPMEELRSAVFGNLAVKVFRSITAAMIESGRLVRDRDVFVLAGRAGGLSPADRRAREQLENAIRAAGLEAPTLAEAAARAGLTEAKARKYYDLMLRDGLLVRLGDLLFHRDALEELKEELRRRAAVNRVLDIGGFRELSGGLSRKYTIPILEWLDRERVTRRVGDRREILVN
jgi:selenocysteine-specific elongation factor